MPRPNLQARIADLVQTPQYNGVDCIVVSWTWDNQDARMNVVTQDEKRLSVKLRNLTFLDKRAETVVISAISKQMQPILAIDVCAANPNNFYTEMGLAAQTESGFTFQSFINCTHVLRLTHGKSIAEPRWGEVKQVLQLKSAEVLFSHNLKRLACEYAEQVLMSDPTNVRATLIMKQ